MLTKCRAEKLLALEAGADQAKAALEKDNETLRGMSLTTNHIASDLTNCRSSQLDLQTCRRPVSRNKLLRQSPGQRGARTTCRKRWGLETIPKSTAQLRSIMLSLILLPVLTTNPGHLEVVDEERGIRRRRDIRQPAQGQDRQVC